MHPKKKTRNSQSFSIAVTLVIAFSALTTSCATPQRVSGVANSQALTAADVLDASPLGVGVALEDVSQVDILALSPGMIEFLDEHVDRSGDQNKKLGQLVFAVIGEGRFELAYDDSTRTAASTFEDRRGNCLSFTNLFIAMARNVGLNASYQEVEIPPDWSMTGQTFLISRHVNVLVAMRNALARVVDFNTVDYNELNDSHVISDQRARAHFFNNIGVEHMLTGDTALAFANFRASLAEDETFSSAWVNLGNLHRREGYPAYAEVAYLEALDRDRNNLMAMSNLANLYQEQGKTALADKYLSRVQAHRLNNPYYRYQLANTAFNNGDYATAIQNLKYAIRQRKDEDRFYYLMSFSYLMSGDKSEAQRWMKKAQEVAGQSEDKKKYQHKLDLLMGVGTS